MELKPEAGSLSSQTRAASGNGHVLTGEASHNNVNWLGSASNIAHILIHSHIRPVAAQDTSRRRVNLTLPANGHPGAFEAEIKAAHAAKQAANG